MVQALSLRIKTILWITPATTPNECGALICGWLKSPFINEIFALSWITWSTTFLYTTVWGGEKRKCMNNLLRVDMSFGGRGREINNEETQTIP